MKALILIVITIFSLSKIALYAVDKVMDNSNDQSILEDYKIALEEV